MRLAPKTGALEMAFGRRSLWSRRLDLPLEGVDLSTIGELRVGGSHSSAA